MQKNTIKEKIRQKLYGRFIIVRMKTFIVFDIFIKKEKKSIVNKF